MVFSDRILSSLSNYFQLLSKCLLIRHHEIYATLSIARHFLETRSATKIGGI